MTTTKTSEPALTITLTARPQCYPAVTISPAPNTEGDVHAAIVAVYGRLADHERAAGIRVAADLRLRSSTQRHIAQEAASAVLRPIMRDVLHWLVTPARGERLGAYARRASRCAAARCAEAGVTAPPAVSHDGAETVGMLGGHVGYDAVDAVSRIERSLTRSPPRPVAPHRARG